MAFLDVANAGPRGKVWQHCSGCCEHRNVLGERVEGCRSGVYGRVGIGLHKGLVVPLPDDTTQRRVVFSSMKQIASKHSRADLVVAFVAVGHLSAVTPILQ